MEETRRVLNPTDINFAALQVVRQLERAQFSAIYGIPRGGIPAALAIQGAWQRLRGGWLPIVAPGLALGPDTLIVDDVWDSGATMSPYLRADYQCAVLYGKGVVFPPGIVLGVAGVKEWLVFPWEDESVGGPDDAVRRLLQFIGEDPDAPHLQETPRRFLSWLSEFRAGQEPDFQDTKFEVRYDGMVIVRRLPFTSLCAHHLLPFSGHATVAYIPHEAGGHASVLGLSKLARIVQHHSHRLQSQEEMTTQIRDAIRNATNSLSVGVLLSAEHSCMNFRGPRVPGAETITSSLSGVFRDEPAARAEFMSLAHASA